MKGCSLSSSVLNILNGLKDFDPFQKYHLMNESELEETDIIRLYLDLIFVSCNRSIHNPDLSALKIVKVAIETEEEEPASETLKSAT